MQVSELPSWPPEGLEQVHECPLCGSDRMSCLYSDLSDRVFYSAPGKWNLYSCEDCQILFLNPRPTPQTIGQAYKRYYTHAPSSGLDRIGKLRWLRDAIGNGYRNKHFGTQLRPATSVGRWITPLFGFKARQIRSELRIGLPPHAGATLLDVGCASGDFLELAGKIGWQADGVDVDVDAIALAKKRGLSARSGGIRSVKDRYGYYDGITLNHVIEHVHEPQSILGECARLLKPGGMLWLETPNADSLGHRIFNKDWLHLDPPRHLILFNAVGLERVVRDSGFSRVEIQPYVPRCLRYFSASAAIAAGRPVFSTGPGLRTIGRALFSDLLERNKPAIREEITIKAWV